MKRTWSLLAGLLAGTFALFMLVSLVGCGGDSAQSVGSDGGVDGLPVDAGSGGSYVAFTSPMEGQIFTRAAGAGGVVAAVPFASRASADVASVEYVAEDVFSLGSADAPGFALSVPFMGDGDRFVVAHGKNAGGQEVASARIGFIVKGPMQMGSTCRDRLDSLGITYTVGPANQGVSDPVTVNLPLNGIKYSTSATATPSTKLFMDCTLALALNHMADLIKPLGVVQIVHLGIYNYRCIGGGDPATGCSVSQHAYAKAIDLNTFMKSDGTSYKVTTDFIIDGTTLPTATPTCSATGLTAKNLWLHMLACLFHTEKVFTIILTPNYNTDHRDHFHVDLTAGSDFIHATDPAAVGVDPPNALGDD